MSKILSKEVLLNLEDLTGKVRITVNTIPANANVVWYYQGKKKYGKSLLVDPNHIVNITDFTGSYRQYTQNLIASDLTVTPENLQRYLRYNEQDGQNTDSCLINFQSLEELDADPNTDQSSIYSTYRNGNYKNLPRSYYPSNYWRYFLIDKYLTAISENKIQCLISANGYFTTLEYIEIPTENITVNIELIEKCIIELGEENVTTQIESFIPQGIKISPVPSGYVSDINQTLQNVPIYDYRVLKRSDTKLEIEKGKFYTYTSAYFNYFESEQLEATSDFQIDINEVDPMQWELYTQFDKGSSSFVDTIFPRNIVHTAENGVDWVSNSNSMLYSIRNGICTKSDLPETQTYTPIELEDRILFYTTKDFSTTTSKTITIDFYINFGFENYDNLQNIFTYVIDTSDIDFTVDSSYSKSTTLYTDIRPDGCIYIARWINKSSSFSESKSIQYRTLFKFNTLDNTITTIYSGKTIRSNYYSSEILKRLVEQDGNIFIYGYAIDPNSSSDGWFMLSNGELVSYTGLNMVDGPVSSCFTWDNTASSFRSIDYYSKQRLYNFSTTSTTTTIERNVSYLTKNELNLNSDLYNDNYLNLKPVNPSSTGVGRFYFRVNNLDWWGTFENMASYYYKNHYAYIFTDDTKDYLYCIDGKNQIVKVWRCSLTDLQQTYNISFIPNSSVNVQLDLSTSAPLLEYNSTNFANPQWTDLHGLKNINWNSVTAPDNSELSYKITSKDGSHIIDKFSDSINIPLNSPALTLTRDITKYSRIWEKEAESSSSLGSKGTTDSLYCSAGIDSSNNIYLYNSNYSNLWQYNPTEQTLSKRSNNRPDVRGRRAGYKFSYPSSYDSETHTLTQTVELRRLLYSTTGSTTGELIDSSQIIVENVSSSYTQFYFKYFVDDNITYISAVRAYYGTTSSDYSAIKVAYFMYIIDEVNDTISVNLFTNSDFPELGTNTYGLTDHYIAFYPTGNDLYIGIPTWDRTKQLIYKYIPNSEANLIYKGILNKSLLYDNTFTGFKAGNKYYQHFQYSIHNSSTGTYLYSDICDIDFETLTVNSSTESLKFPVIKSVQALTEDTLLCSTRLESDFAKEMKQNLIQLDLEDLSKSRILDISWARFIHSNPYKTFELQSDGNYMYMLAKDSGSSTNTNLIVWKASIQSFLNVYIPQQVPEYTLGQDINNSATVIGETMDSIGRSLVYAVVNPENWSYALTWGPSVDTGLTNCTTNDAELDIHSATENTDYIVQNYSLNDYPLFDFVNNIPSIVVDGVAYKAAVPTAKEVIGIFTNKSILINKFPNARVNGNTVRTLLDATLAVTSQEIDSTRYITVFYTKQVGSGYKNNAFEYLYPVIEIPGRIVS